VVVKGGMGGLAAKPTLTNATAIQGLGILMFNSY
jgi:hypothetical protein